MKRVAIFSVLIFSFAFSFAKVSKIEISSRQVILGGRSFGSFGAYEYLKGTIYFETDPANPFNSRVTDIGLAPVNENGMIESSANFEVLQPADPSKRRGVALVEVSNRGGKFSLRYFNRSSSSAIDPEKDGSFGEGLLMRQGLTVIWVGWQFDVPDGENVLKLKVPTLEGRIGVDLEGVVRSDWTVDEDCNTLTLGHRSQKGYPATNTGDARNLLTVRDGREAPRTVVDRSEWSFSTLKDGAVIPDSYTIYSSAGFRSGKIYELVYLSDAPVLTGLGLTAVRDIISYARYDESCPFPVKKGFAAGVSQTGRFLRHFLYQGFNTDENGKKAFDGMMIITAGAGRGSFNHRFAQPSRDAHDYSAFFYPTDIFPFTSLVYLDKETWRSDGLLAHMWDETHIPLIMSINTGYEYWGRAASLIHIDPLSSNDAQLHNNERIYHLASGQHYVGAEPSERNRMPEGPGYRTNPLDYSVNYRSLLVKMTDWVDNGKEPPASCYPRIGDGTLVDPLDIKYPGIEGLVLNYTPHVAYTVNYGPRWEQGIIDYEPPLITKPFRSLVPQLDSIGNESGGVRNIEVAVPLATYLPWNLRVGFAGSVDEQTDFTGTFIPLRQDYVKGSDGDSRPSISGLYRNKKYYLNRVAEETTKLVSQGFMLPEDVEYSKTKAEKRWDRWVENSK